MKLATLSDTQFQAALANFAAKISNYPAITLTGEEVDRVKSDSLFFTYIIDSLNQIKQHGKDWTSYKNILRSSTGKVNLGDVPIWTAGNPPFVAPADISGRWSKLIQRIKSDKNYTEAIGNDLGITAITTGTTSADWAALKPILKILLVAGQPVIEWKKGDADGIAIYSADANSGEYNFLAIDLHPHFVDKRALPAAGLSVVRKYKAIYLLNDEQVGQWSDEISVGVMG